MERVRPGRETDHAVVGGREFPDLSGHFLVPDLETAAPVLLPVVVEIDQHVQPPFHQHRLVHVEIRMDVEMPAVQRPVNTGPGEIGIRDQSLDAGHLLQER